MGQARGGRQGEAHGAVMGAAHDVLQSLFEAGRSDQNSLKLDLRARVCQVGTCSGEHAGCKHYETVRQTHSAGSLFISHGGFPLRSYLNLLVCLK